MNDEILKTTADAENYTIYTSMCKAQRILMKSYDPICSITVCKVTENGFKVKALFQFVQCANLFTIFHF